MPFVPFTEEEREKLKPPCTHPEHNPPTHFYARDPMKWQCPGCGITYVISPPMVQWGPRVGT